MYCVDGDGMSRDNGPLGGLGTPPPPAWGTEGIEGLVGVIFMREGPVGREGGPGGLRAGRVGAAMGGGMTG